MRKGKQNDRPRLLWQDALLEGGELRAVGLASQWLNDNPKLQDDLEWLVLPPLLAGQFRIWRRGATPVAYGAWALLDEATEERLLAGEFRLGPCDWRGGDRLWLIYLFAPYGGLRWFVRQLREREFPGRAVATLAIGADGVRRKVYWPAIPIQRPAPRHFEAPLPVSTPVWPPSR